MKWYRAFFRRRCLWCPTWKACFSVFLFFLVPGLWWCLHGEAFLALNRKVPAQVLAVECWIGRSGVRAAAEEYKKGNYTYIIATGPTIGRGWEVEGSNVAELAEQELLQQGIPGKEIIVARARKTNRNRTYESAVSSRSELGNRNLTPSAITVFTLGLHARRSRLVFSEVFGRDTEIGVISWSPPNYEDSHWTSSTERIEAMVIETLSYLLRRFTNLF